MPKILHISDTHIPVTKRHDEYREVFAKIYDLAREQKVTHIVHTGDLFHSKLQLTPECVSLAVDFLRNLSEIAPLYMICGNHDCTLRNSKRLDSISPIVEAINSDRIHYFKKSGEYNFGNITFGAFSMLDPDNYPKVSDKTKLNIALYHGSISGVMTDSGYVISHGDCDVSIFDEYDYVLLGDIHQTNQKVDDDGRVRYVGSTIQQNFGETDDKGVMIWDISSKDKFKVNHYNIPCPKPFITLEINEDGEVNTNKKIPKNSRIRLVTNHNLSVDRVKNAIDVSKTAFKPESVTFVNKALTNKENLQKVSNLSKVMNLRDVSVQEELIEEYLKQYNPDREMIDKVFEMNRRINSQVEQGEEVARNINWDLKSLEWDNLFNYGEGNKIDFTKLNGVVGILGKNYSGKSSAGVDSLLYTLFNTTSKNNRKNLNIINQNKDKAIGKAIFEIDGNEYTINRTSEKYTKKSKGVEITEAKTDVEFSGVDESTLTGLDRSDTDKIIRKYLGTVDDFMLTSVATQFSAQSFISEGSTNRKAILAKFLDLDIFEAKFKAAKSEAADIKALLKKLEGSDHDEAIKKLNDDIKKAQDAIEVAKQDLLQNQKLLNLKREELFEAQSEIKQISIKDKNYTDAFFQKSHQEILKKQLEDKININTQDIESIKESIKDLESDLSIKIEEFLDKKAQIDACTKSLTQLKAEQKLARQSDDVYGRQIKVLSEVPCGSEFSHCKFIKDAYASQAAKPLSEQKLVQIGQKISSIEKECEELDSKTIEETIRKYNSALSLKHKYELDIKEHEVNFEKLNGKLQTCTKDIEKWDNILAEREKDQELIELLESLKQKETSLKKEVVEIEMKISSAQNQTTTLYKDIGYLISSLEKSEEDRQELADKRKEYGAYDLYLKAMHPNGISYQVIKNKLPVINEEINKILANVVDFEIFLVNDDDKLDIMIKHPKYDARPIEMGSGAEKSLASIAIRLAFLQITSLPKCSVFFMDEPGTSLDADNLSGFIRMLDLIKSSFKTVILISHLDALKEAVDMQIVIDRKDDYAYVNQ